MFFNKKKKLSENSIFFVKIIRVARDNARRGNDGGRLNAPIFPCPQMLWSVLQFVCNCLNVVLKGALRNVRFRSNWLPLLRIRLLVRNLSFRKIKSQVVRCILQGIKLRQPHQPHQQRICRILSLLQIFQRLRKILRFQSTIGSTFLQRYSLSSVCYS